MAERLMPGSPEAERAILGAILLDNSAYDQAAHLLEPGDFFLDSHRRIFLRMMELASDATRAIDFVTLTERLGQNKEVEAVGGVTYVTSLTDGLPRVKNIGQYVRIVKDKATLRKLIHVSNGAVSAAFDNELSANSILGTLHDQVLTLQGNSRKGDAAKVSEFSDETWKQLLARRDAEHRLVGMSTGLDSLDYRTTGIRRGEFWTIGGRTGDGKTALALQMAAANASQGIPVAYFSIEMDRHSLLERLWSGAGQIDYKKIRDPKLLTEVEAFNLGNIKDEVDRWPLYIEDSEAYTIAEIEARSRLLIRQKSVAKVVVDYIQIVDAPGREEKHRVTKVSKSLRQLAKGENVGVVGVSQMSRPKDHNLNRRPTKFDMKESGSLENDSHTVLLIYRPVDDEDDYNGKDELIVAKQRGGDTGYENVLFRGKFMRFESRI